MTAFLLVFTSQISDGLAFALGISYGFESNPIMRGLYDTGGVPAILAAKLVVALVAALIVTRKWPRYAPAVSLVGFVGCLSELLAIPH